MSLVYIQSERTYFAELILQSIISRKMLVVDQDKLDLNFKNPRGDPNPQPSTRIDSKDRNRTDTYAQRTKSKPKITKLDIVVADEHLSKLSMENLAVAVRRLKLIGTIKTLFQQENKLIIKFGEDFRPMVLYALEDVKLSENITIKGYVTKKREREKVVTLFKVPPQVENVELTNYLMKYGGIVGEIRRQKYKTPGLEEIENGNVTIKMSQTKHPLGSVHWLGGSRVDAFFPGIERTCFWCMKTQTNCDANAVGKDCKMKGNCKMNQREYFENLWTKIGWTQASSTNDVNTTITNSSNNVDYHVADESTIPVCQTDLETDKLPENDVVVDKEESYEKETMRMNEVFLCATDPLELRSSQAIKQKRGRSSGSESRNSKSKKSFTLEESQ